MPRQHRALSALVSDPVRLPLEGPVIPKSTGLVFKDKVTFQVWESIGQRLLSAADSTTWWIADWLVYGEESFQDRYREAIQRTSLKYQTLRNYTWIGRQFDLSRRHDNLSFGHHAEVAALDQPEQDYWLRKAEELNWSRNQLRSQIRTSLRERAVENRAAISQGATGLSNETVDAELQDFGDGDGDGTINVTLRLTAHQFTRLTLAAKNQKKGLEEWALQALKVAAGQ
jgi:hypothetical protein